MDAGLRRQVKHELAVATRAAFEVVARGRVRVLLDREAGGCVSEEDRAQAFVQTGRSHRFIDVARALVQALTGDGE